MATSEEEKIKTFSGVEKAAILLRSLGDVGAAEVLKLMNPKSVQKIGEAMAIMSTVNKESLDGVLVDFHDVVNDLTELGVGNEDYLRSILVSALGEDKAGNIIDRILMGHNAKGLETLKWMEPRAIAEIIRLEHPQIISIIISYLEPDQGAAVLQALPENMRTDILLRIATLDGIQPSALYELDEMLEKQFAGNTDSIKSSGVGGLKTAANMLNFMESSFEAPLMESVRQVDEEICDKIQDLMFVFDNLVDIDDRGVQSLLREVSSENLIVALKGADNAVQDKILNNMSKRAAEMLRDDLETKGPVKVSEVETAQKEILTIARRMAESGEIDLGGGAGDEYV